MSTIRLGALVSGGGRTLLNLADRIDDGTLPATIAATISSRAEAPAVERLAARGLPVETLTDHDAITACLVDAGVDLVCLCGYLKWFRIDGPFAERVINIHPALLPKFGGKGMYGLRVHRAVLDAGETTSGCTVHFVDDQYDHGPVILQRTCPVHRDDDPETLATRVFEQECLAYPEAIRLVAEDRLRLTNGTVSILPG